MVLKAASKRETPPWCFSSFMVCGYVLLIDPDVPTGVWRGTEAQGQWLQRFSCAQGSGAMINDGLEDPDLRTADSWSCALCCNFQQLTSTSTKMWKASSPTLNRFIRLGLPYPENRGDMKPTKLAVLSTCWCRTVMVHLWIHH